MEEADAGLFIKTFGSISHYQEYRLACAGGIRPAAKKKRNGQAQGNEVMFTEWYYEARIPLEVRPFAIGNAGKKRFSPMGSKNYMGKNATC